MENRGVIEHSNSYIGSYRKYKIEELQSIVIQVI